MTIELVDGNNILRRKLQLEGSLATLRTLYEDANYGDNLKIYVWDGKNANARRRAIYPDYKMGRKPAPDEIYKTIDEFKSLLQLSRCLSVEVPGYEADDVIAHVVGKLGDDVLIDSNDMDFAQLGVPMTRTKFPVEAQWIRLYKTLVGDQSDNIKGVPGFGEKAWEGLNKPMTEAWINRQTTPSLPIFPKRCATWVLENFDLIRSMYEIVGFIKVPDQLVEDNLITGRFEPHLADQVLKEMLL